MSEPGKFVAISSTSSSVYALDENGKIWLLVDKEALPHVMPPERFRWVPVEGRG